MNAELKPSLKLMIVDDSNIIRRRIERSQQIDRLEVVGAASNGREAVELFRRTQPDVVTMDLTMPEMDGVECVQQLVAINSKVLILVVSALADKATAVTNTPASSAFPGRARASSTSPPRAACSRCC